MRLLRTGWILGLSFVVGTAVANAQPPATEAGAALAAPADTNAAAPASAAAPAAPVEGAPPAGAAPTGAATEGGAYNVRLRSLQRNVDELKEQVFRVKTRLNLLKETVLGGVIGASRAVIRHKNEMGTSFRLVRAVYALDGVQIYAKSDETGGLANMTEFDIYSGAIQPGSHTLTVQLMYQGYGYGVFSYLKNYKFNVRSSQTFVAGDGKHTVVTVKGREKSGVTTKVEDKPEIFFEVANMTPEGAPAAAGKK